MITSVGKYAFQICILIQLPYILSPPGFTSCCMCCTSGVGGTKAWNQFQNQHIAQERVEMLEQLHSPKNDCYEQSCEALLFLFKPKHVRNILLRHQDTVSTVERTWCCYGITLYKIKNLEYKWLTSSVKFKIWVKSHVLSKAGLLSSLPHRWTGMWNDQWDGGRKKNEGSTDEVR